MSEPGPLVVDAREAHDRVMRAVTIMLNDETPKAVQLEAAEVTWKTEAGQVTIAAGIIGRLCGSTAALLTEASPNGRAVTAADVWRASSAGEAAAYETVAAIRRRMAAERDRQEPA